MAYDISFRGEISNMSAAYFCREIETLPARASATIYLHTPGGDIYAGGEMVNALRSAMTKRGCKFTIEVGSLCASMGAALLAAARANGASAKCHPNSEAMFHGCWSIMAGGADEMSDQAKAMRDFNECVRRDLKKCGIDDTEEWFAADRQKWLNAEEMLALGLVDSISGEDSDDKEDLKDSAVKIAAMYNHNNKERTMDENTEPIKPEEAKPVETAPANDPQQSQEETTPAQPTEAEIEERVNALANQRFAGLQAKHEKMITDLVKERDAARKDLAEANAKVTSLNADVEKLNADLAEVRDQLAKSEQNRESIVVSALAPAAELPTMKDGLEACKTLAERAEFLRAGNFKHN